MLSPLRTLIKYRMPILLLAVPSALGGQQLSAHVTVTIRVTVHPVVAIRSVVAMTTSDAGAVVNVESNLPYRITVRLAPSATSERARVLVRSASGHFEPLDVGGSVIAAVSATPGQRRHEVLCRVESSATNRCALIFELSAQHHDMLIRSTASFPASSNPELGMRIRQIPMT